MSTNQQRLKSAIRRLAKTDPDIQSAISAAKNRGDQAGVSASASSGGDGSKICCDGSTSTANPGVDATEVGDGQSGLDPNDPARLSLEDGGSLSGVTDCETGQPICIDGQQWALPDGWDEPNEPPVIDAYEAGTYFYGQFNGDITSPSPFAVGDTICARWLEGSESRQSCTVIKVTDDLYEVEGEDAFIFGTIEIRDVTRKDCAADPDPACNEPPPTEDSWPSDGCVNLAVKGGSIVGSKYDPDQSGAYSKPMSEINLCDGNGNQITLAPSADGGWKTIDAINGGDGYLYDSQGKQIARISGDEFSDPAI